MNNNLNTIKTLRDVYNIASKMFPCGAKKVHDLHAKGYMGVKLIVGEKQNPTFDPTADPTKPGLTPEQRKQQEEKSKNAIPDVRILWIAPGTTAKELVKEFLQPIKESLEKKEPIIDYKTSMISKEEVSDSEMAARVARGEVNNVEFEEDEEEEIEFGGSGINLDEDESAGEENFLDEGNEDEEDNGNDEGGENIKMSDVLEAIRTLGENVEVLADGLKKTNKRIDIAIKKK